MQKTKKHPERYHYARIQSEEVTCKKTLARMHRYVNFAKAMFRQGFTSHGRTFNVCFAFRKSKLIAVGVNDYDRSMMTYNYKLKTSYKRYGEESYCPCLHAEMSAVLKLKTDDCSDVSFYNVRLNKHCKCCNSQPCSNCVRILKMVNARNIFFYDDDMSIRRMV